MSPFTHRQHGDNYSIWLSEKTQAGCVRPSLVQRRPSILLAVTVTAIIMVNSSGVGEGGSWSLPVFAPAHSFAWNAFSLGH